MADDRTDMQMDVVFVYPTATAPDEASALAAEVDELRSENEHLTAEVERLRTAIAQFWKAVR
jgi:hypothetical protein